MTRNVKRIILIISLVSTLSHCSDSKNNLPVKNSATENDVSFPILTHSDRPTKIRKVSDIYPVYQINLNLIDLLGKFYHKQSSFPEIRSVSDISIVKLLPELEDMGQDARISNLFILDGNMGVLAFSKGNISAGAVRHAELKGARRISVLPDGTIALIDQNGNLNLCYSFNGQSILRDENCETGPAAKEIAAFDADKLLILKANNAIAILDVSNREMEDLHLRGIENPTNISSDGETLTVIYKNGYAIRSFREKGDNCVKYRKKWRTCQKSARDPGKSCCSEKYAWHSCKKKHTNKHRYKFLPVATVDGAKFKIPDSDAVTMPVKLKAIVRNLDGNYYAVSENALMYFNSKLKPLTYWKFPGFPIPFQHMKNVMGIEMYASSHLFHIFNKSAVTVYAEGDFSPNTAIISRQVPPELAPVLNSIIQNLDNINLITDNLFTNEHVAPVLKQSLQDLQLQ